MEVFINMEFFIRKNSTLPVIEIDFIKEGRTDYNTPYGLFTSEVVYFSMVDVDTGFYKVLNTIASIDQTTKTVYYQLTKKNTNKVGRYEVEFSIKKDGNTIKVPLRDKIFLNVIDSFSDPDQCCKSIVLPIETFRIKTQSNLLIRTQNGDYINYQH